MSNYEENLRRFEQEVFQSPRPSYGLQLKFYDILIPILGIIIIGINLIVVFSSGLILKKRPQPRSTYIFLGNVALADMLTGVATLFGHFYPKENRSEIVCCIEVGMIISSTLASVYSIALIAIDRYLYISFGLQYQRYLASNRARLMVLGTWLLGLIVGSMPLMGVRNATNNGEFCWIILVEPTILLLLTVTLGIAPLFVVILLYSLILKRALLKISEMKTSENATHDVANQKGKQSTQLRYFRGGLKSSLQLNDNNRHAKATISYIPEATIDEVQHSHKSLFNCCRRSGSVTISSAYSPSRWKAIKIVALTTGCYFVTWFPYFIACLLYTACDYDKTPCHCDNLRVAIASPLAILGFTNSLLNPIIYAWWHNGFRESAKKIYNDIWRKRIRQKNNTFSVSYKSRKVDSITRSTDLNDSKTECGNELTSVSSSNDQPRSAEVVLGITQLLYKQN